MSDNGTRSKGTFEPPPWEREAFDALAARRAEEQAVAAALAAAAAKDAVIVEPPKPADPWAEEPVRAAEAAVPSVDAVDGAGSARQGAVTVDERAVEAMLTKLQAEETSDGTATVWVGWVASGVTFLLGGAMAVAGLLSVRGAEAKFANVVGSAVLVIFGLCFVGMAIWVWVRTNRSRGRR